MRVAIDLRADGPARGGIGRYVRDLTRAIVEIDRGHEYRLVTTRERRMEPWAGFARVQCHRTWVPLCNRYFYLWERLVLPLHLSRWGVDVFHGPTGIIPARKLPAATVVTVHDLTPFEFPHWHNQASGKVFRHMAERSIGAADGIIAVSESTRQQLVDRFGISKDRVAVVHLGIDPVFRPLTGGLSSGLRQRGLRTPFVLAVGTVEPRKNHVRLIEAFERIAGTFGDLQLVVAGRRGWLFEPVMKRMRLSPVSQRILFVEFVTDAELVELYGSAAAVAYPSLYEGFGLPPLEAIACGAPVLASNRASIPEVVGDAALLIDPTSVDEIAAGLVALLTRTSLRQRLRRAGLRRTQRYSWRAAAEATMEVYQRALIAKRRGGH